MRQLAIMDKPHFGLRDVSYPVFWFSVSYGQELSCGALIVLGVKSFCKIIEDAGIVDIDNLEGAACQVNVDDRGVRFVKIIKTVNR